MLWPYIVAGCVVWIGIALTFTRDDWKRRNDRLRELHIILSKQFPTYLHEEGGQERRRKELRESLYLREKTFVALFTINLFSVAFIVAAVLAILFAGMAALVMITIMLGI